MASCQVTVVLPSKTGCAQAARQSSAAASTRRRWRMEGAKMAVPSRKWKPRRSKERQGFRIAGKQGCRSIISSAFGGVWLLRPCRAGLLQDGCKCGLQFFCRLHRRQRRLGEQLLFVGELKQKGERHYRPHEQRGLCAAR